MRLIVDDLRTFAFPSVYARSSADAISALAAYPGAWTELWLDHDMGGADTTMPVVDWLLQNKPFALTRVVIHTQNPVGRQRIEKALSRQYEILHVSAADYL